ncbi:MAG: L,D-transpeptidase family protein [Geminicoccaceae bacterium]
MRFIVCVLATLLTLPGSVVATVKAAVLDDPLAVSVLEHDPGLQAIYAGMGSKLIWSGDPEADARRGAMLALLALERKSEPAAVDALALSTRFADLSPAARTEADLALSRAALAYLSRRSTNPSVPTTEALTALHRLDLPVGANALALAELELMLIQDLGGWREVATVAGPLPTVSPVAVVSPEVDVSPALPPRKRLPEPESLRWRLVQSADLSVRYRLGDSMDQQLIDAVRRFQRRHGLTPDGVVGTRTLAALNEPVSRQIAQVRINLARPVEDRSGLQRYVEVNIPGYELKLVEHGMTVLRSRVVVGEKDKPTPIFDDRIRYIEFNPSWYVPDSITPELVDKERQRPGYLAKNGFYWRTAAETGALLDRLVQRPGPENALGRIKFLFPNHDAIYLHDTPQRGAFGRSDRSLSHGCIRVEKHFELALALLQDQGWDAKRLDATYAMQKTRRISLSQPVPIFLDYRTAFVDDEGRLNLRNDLYGHDTDGTLLFARKGLPPEPSPPIHPSSAPIMVRDVAPLQGPPAPASIGPGSTANEEGAAPS